MTVLKNEYLQKVARIEKNVLGGLACAVPVTRCSSGEFYTGLRYNIADARAVTARVRRQVGAEFKSA